MHLVVEKHLPLWRSRYESAKCSILSQKNPQGGVSHPFAIMYIPMPAFKGCAFRVESELEIRIQPKKGGDVAGDTKFVAKINNIFDMGGLCP